MNKFNYIKNISEDKAVILLYKPIGSWVDNEGNEVNGISGELFANEMLYLESQGVKEVEVRINSIGGSVLEGYSIISAIQNSNMKVTTINDGMAASISAIIFICGHKRLMKEHSILMIHNPSGGSNDLLNVIKSSLLTILNNNCILIEEELNKLMDNETYFTAEECLQNKLIDEIISSTKVRLETKDKYEMMEIFNSLIKKEMTEEINNVEEVENKLGMESPTTLTNEVETEEVPETEVEGETEENNTTVIYNRLKASMELADDADEDSMISAYSTLKDSHSKLMLENEALKTKLEEVAKEAKKAHKSKIDHMVNDLYTAGKIGKEDIENVTKMADFDFEATKNMFGKIGVIKSSNIMDVVNADIKSTSTLRKDWTIRDYEKKAPEKLEEIKNNTPSLYNILYKETYGVEPK
jgi:ATP-dependent protease ClpP protease subunit